MIAAAACLRAWWFGWVETSSWSCSVLLRPICELVPTRNLLDFVVLTTTVFQNRCTLHLLFSIESGFADVAVGFTMLWLFFSKLCILVATGWAALYQDGESVSRPYLSWPTYLKLLHSQKSRSANSEVTPPVLTSRLSWVALTYPVLSPDKGGRLC